MLLLLLLPLGQWIVLQQPIHNIGEYLVQILSAEALGQPVMVAQQVVAQLRQLCGG